MHVAAHDFDQLLQEHRALLRAHGAAQARCSELARHAARLEAQVMRLRGALVARDTALACVRADREELERSIPGLPRRVELARQVTRLQARVHELMRTQDAGARGTHGTPVAAERARADDHLERSIAAADLVICQAGCMSQGAYWRVRDHCRRTGKPCVLVDQPDLLRIVRIEAEA
jgi:hypothetical protein